MDDTRSCSDFCSPCCMGPPALLADQVRLVARSRILAVHVAPSFVAPYRALARIFSSRRMRRSGTKGCETCGHVAPAPLASASALESYLDWRIGSAAEERLLCLYYDAQGRFQAESVFEGGVAQVVAARAGLVESATGHGAHLVVMAHNHPGGDAAPSRQDVLATRQVHRLFAALGMSLADHVIIARGGARFSFRRAGLL